MRHKQKQTSDDRTVLGITLSKRGWNNVLIYVVLIFMFVFYFLGNDSGKVASKRTWQPFQERFIVALADAQVSLVRVGNRWEQRQSNGVELTVEQQQQWLQAWQNISLEVSDGLLQGREYQVEITFADEAESWVVGVFFSQGRTLVALPEFDYVFQVLGDASKLEAVAHQEQ